MSETAYVLRFKEDLTYHRGTDRDYSVPVKGEYYPKGSGQLSTKSLFAARMYTKKPMQFEGGQSEIVQIKLEVVS